MGIVYEVYDLHMKRLSQLTPKSNALFVSHLSEKPISGQMYAKKFNLVKEKFLEYLRIKNKDDYNYLNSHNWSSHFGRGVFTNFLIQDLGWNAEEVRLMRGDKSLTSTQAYIDKYILIQNAKKTLDIVPKVIESKEFMKYTDMSNIIRALKDN